ncbi:sporulation kinase E [bacterium BMS3Abin05]|nr:sporulation kinase E [bacterium BMS3Abin05]GBE27221.1 sporulation kinase E [bacterium BMS3Bbin03]HDZ10632.1 PAS domain S-box protein [Bacteroidota bacterium]
MNPDGKKKSVLLIDDDPDMLDIGRIIIRKAGYHFVEATTPNEGFDKIEKHHPNLVLLDYMMPDMKGDEFFERFASDEKFEPYRDIPVIMLTARSDNGIDRVSLFKKGLAAFLVKPFGHRELINIIENVLQLNEIRSQNMALQQEIKRTQYKYRDLVENANDLIFTLDEAGRFVFVNNRIQLLTGFSENEWLHQSIFDVIVQDDHEIIRHAFQECLSGNCGTVEFRILHKKGGIHYFSANLNPLHDQKKIGGVVGIARDITDRIKLENQIVELKNFNESIIKSIGSGLITVDLDRKITYFNAGAEKILKIPVEEVIGNPIDKILPPKEVEKFLPVDQKESFSPLNREMEVTNGKGNKVFIGFTNTPWVDNANRKMGTIISFRDISEIKRLQIEMIRMDRLASLGVLASGIAHEIRNPLAGIKTMAQTLEEEIEPDDSRREYPSRIIRQVNRLDELLKAFFSYARPRPPIKKWHDLPDIVHEVVVLLNKKISSSKIDLSEIYDENLPKIFVDLNQIQQVFINLILNAVDAMSEGGHLVIKARAVTTRVEAVDRRRKIFRNKRLKSLYTEVLVKDTGSGIQQAHLEAIFDPFFTTKSQGTGLGLSIVYRILEEHGGNIKVTSEPGKGTTFALLLPSEE